MSEISQSLKLKHHFFIIAGKAWISYLDKIFNPFASYISAPFPISIRNTGDELFLTNMHESATTTSTELYNRIPRMDIDVKGISLLGDQLTNPINMGHMNIIDSQNYNTTRVHEVRRLPVEWTFSTSIKFNDIVEYLVFVDILLTVSFHDHSFSFWYLGQKYEASFYMPTDFESEANLQLGWDTEKRHRVLDIVFAIQLQFPAYNFYNVGQPNDNTWQGFGKTETMNQLIHNLHLNDTSEEGIVSTTIIPD